MEVVRRPVRMNSEERPAQDAKEVYMPQLGGGCRFAVNRAGIGTLAIVPIAVSART